MEIKRINRVKIESYSESDITDCHNKCHEALKLIEKSAKLKSDKFIIQAVSLYEDAILIYPKNPEPYICMAYLASKMDKYSEAIQLLTKAVDLQPENKKVRLLLAKMKMKGSSNPNSRSQATLNKIESQKVNVNNKLSKSSGKVDDYFVALVNEFKFKI